ncbi:hypothetical protein OEZ86_002760 [Tetradesmus obliquus]|nr:hypothetical protein OEZ86_002760 [Tetradesmus obliquus]
MAKDKIAEAPPMHKPPGTFTACRWFFFCATVAIAIGMLALIDQHLMGIKWIYDGPLLQYQGRHITISYCLLSPSSAFSVDGNCNFAIAAATVSLAISLIWSYIQVLRRNPFKHSKAKLADLGICSLAMLFWAAAGIVLCLFTDRANKAGMPHAHWRNVLCVLAWLLFLMFAGLTFMSLLLVTRRSQKLFDKSLGHWQQLLSLASAQSLQCPEAQYAQQQLAATVVAPEQTATGAQVSAANNAGLVRSRVVRNRRGYWRIRHFQPTDLYAVADLQAAAFHEALPVGALDRLAYTMFKAEVLDAVKKKVDVLCEHGFAMMVVESCAVGPGGNCSAADASTLESFIDDAGSSSDGSEGCAEDWESAVWYGRALLQAAEQQAANWEQELVALHVYENNPAAIRLYERHGMRCCAQDPAWKAMLGGKVRQLMIKPVPARQAGSSSSSS